MGRSTIAAGLDLSPRRRHTRTRRLSLDKQKRDSSENTTLCHSVIHVDLARHHSKRWRLFDINIPFILKRQEFPLGLAFPMTINKAQGQTFARVGLLLQEPVFIHEQLYVAFSLEAQILTRTNVGHTVLVPKIYFAPSDISLPFILKRHQFSLKLAFVMTINNIWVLATRACVYAWTALCGFFTCSNFGQNTYKVEPMYE
ncbi:hypothetical protein LAZ67_11002273 [Cordylochernes scorpioides]|uniref:ATP-dependent DNA helicase n=1 Tax=Cordylochernes scorpioides TaxID=51811 RepID=A0ABY6L1V9_9ARAC|nr:hypothetical protein LAZ67_11002273 [Cordylochernes scorpioides]